MVKRVGILFFIIYQGLSGHTQSFTTINYSVPEGLPSSEVYEVIQDRQGFLWFATDNGVARFDGKEMEIFNVKNGLTDPVVFNIQEDEKGRLWFRTFSGKLCFYENGEIKKYVHNDTLVSFGDRGLIHFTYQSKLDELWFASKDVFGKINSNGVVSTEPVPLGLNYKTIGNSSLFWGNCFYRNCKSIIINNEIFPLEVPDTTKIGVSCQVNWKGKLYLTTYNKIFEYNGKQLSTIFDADAPIISLSMDKENNLWVGYFNRGVERYSHSDFKKPWRPEFLKDKSVTKVLQDEEGGFWFTTLENGIFHIPNLLIEHYALPSTPKLKTIISTEDSVLVGDQSGNLSVFSTRTKKFVSKISFNSPVLSLLSDSKKRIWLSTQADIHIFGSQHFVIKKVNASDFKEDSPDCIWAVSGNAVAKYSPDGKRISRNGFRSLHRALLLKDSLIFLVNRTGMQVRNKNLELMDIPENLSDYKISKIDELNDSTLLIATIGRGFLLFNIKRWTYTAYDTENNFIADNVYSIMKTDSTFWLGTEKGIAIVTIRSLLNKNPYFEYLTRKSGLISDKINFLVRGYNSVWAFSDNGFSVIPDVQVRFANKIPRFHLKRIIVNTVPLQLTSETELEHTQNSLRVMFGYLSFNNQNIFTRYRLNPEKSWNYTNDRTLQFNSLSPGSYVVELQSSSDNINWVPAYTSSAIVITPPLWQTWYFQTMIALVVLLVIVLYFVNQVRIYKIHQRKLIQAELEAIEEERGRIARDLHDSVGTDFSAIKMIVTQLLTKHSEPKTTEVETQFQSTIQDIKNIIYGLSPPGLERYGLFSALKNYVDKLNGTIPIKIEISTFGVEIKDSKLSMTIFRIIQELIANSLKHSKAESITLHINSFKDLLNIVYEDNGIGFSFDDNRKGLGLYNIESRIHAINGQLKFASGVFGVSYAIDIPVDENIKA